MTRKELSTLIDKVVGTKGVMRASVWWVKRMLNQIVEYLQSYTDSAVKKVKVKCDTEMSSSSENPVQNKVIKEYVDKNKVAVDSSISDSSTNPVQNKVVKSYVDQYAKIEIVEISGDYSVHLTPNKYHIYTGSSNSLDVYTTDSKELVLSTYWMEFEVDDLFSLTLHNGVSMENGEPPVFTRGKHILIIQRGIARVISNAKPLQILDDVPNVETDYLTFVALCDNAEYSFPQPLEYSINNGDWVALDANQNTPAINAGEYVSFRANLVPNATNGIGTFKITSPTHVTGDCKSLLFGDDAAANSDISSKSYAFYGLFRNTHVVSVSANLLPATTLAYSCYLDMFSGCRLLRNAPKLLATELKYQCYRYMFHGCTSLVDAPELPATTLAEECYRSMFSYCVSLVNAPALPAIEIARYCYEYMFSHCVSLVDAPALPATELQFYCYYGMFQNCDSLVNAPVLPATTMAGSCYNSMFDSCVSLVNAPELPATTLDEWCYQYMFKGCSSLTTAPELPATTLANGCYAGMFYGCDGLINAPELPALDLVYKCYDSMFAYCSSLNYIKAMFLTTPSKSYTDMWLFYVPENGTFVKNAAATWNSKDSFGVPYFWTIEYAEA